MPSKQPCNKYMTCLIPSETPYTALQSIFVQNTIKSPQNYKIALKRILKRSKAIIFFIMYEIFIFQTTLKLCILRFKPFSQ